MHAASEVDLLVGSLILTARPRENKERNVFPASTQTPRVPVGQIPLKKGNSLKEKCQDCFKMCVFLTG
jgi:hypothetical protein